MFHHTRKLLIKRYFRRFQLLAAAAISTVISLFGGISTAADQPANLASFDPAKGFKPAQGNLTEVFEQIAGSLEYYGTPEPYLRHMKAEHERVEAKYQKQTGHKPRSFCPAYMNSAYFDQFTANWQHMAAPLGLESLTKNTGRLMGTVIDGPDGKGTILVNVFNDYQNEVSAAMTNKMTVPIPDFDALKASLEKCLKLDEFPSPAAGLTADQQAVVQPTDDIRAAFLKLFSALDAGLPATDAEKVKTFLLSIVDDVGRMAESEMKVASLEASLNELHSPQAPYSADQETALSVGERRILAGFLKKSRFTRADFPALDKFYSGPYDRLTERGKDEMSKRIHAGMRPAS